MLPALITLQLSVNSIDIPCIVSISFDLDTRPLPGHFAVCRRSSGLASIRYLWHMETHRVTGKNGTISVIYISTQIYEKMLFSCAFFSHVSCTSLLCFLVSIIITVKCFPSHKVALTAISLALDVDGWLHIQMVYPHINGYPSHY